MAEVLWQSDVQKVSGLAIVMILVVSRILPCGVVSDVSNLRPALRRVLHLKMVTQCAILEDFGLFLVLADKVQDSFFSSQLFLVITIE